MMRETILRDLRFALRSLRRQKGFTLAALATLALGIGASTAIFSVVNGVLLRPLPYRAPEELMMIDEQWQPRFSHFEATPTDILQWQEHSRALNGVAAWVTLPFNFSVGNTAERVPGARVTWNLPAVLGVEPIMGRTFRQDEDKDGNHLVVLISHELWRRVFNSSERVIGESLKLNGLSYVVIGVMPSGFRFPHEAHVWRPMAFLPRELGTTGHFVWGVGRLRAGFTPAQAQEELNRIMSSAQKSVWSANVYPLTDYYVGGVRPALGILSGAVGFVLLIACANVANLLLARAAVRQHEITLRASLGATRSRIVQQLVTESLVLSGAAGLLGWALAIVGVDVLRQVAPASIPRLDDITFDYSVLLFTVGVSLLAGLLFSVVPAMQAAHTDLRSGAQSGTKGAGAAIRHGARQALVVSEVALALVLLVAAGLMVKSFWRLAQVDPGFRPEGAVASQTLMPLATYPGPQAYRTFVTRLVDRVRQSPGTEAVAVTSALPLVNITDVGIRFDREENPGTTAQYYRVTPDYLRVMGIPVVKGRFFGDRDIDGSPAVVVINETMARRFFPNEDPIGKRLAISAPSFMREIVGVVGDVKQASVDGEVVPQVYEPYLQVPTPLITVVARMTGDPARAATELRRSVAEIDRELPLGQIQMMTEVVSRSLAARRFAATLLALFSAIAVVLAGIGIYGLIAYTTAQRTREFAVRLAVGAEPRMVLWMVAVQTARLVLVGVGLGVVGSLALTRFLDSQLYEVTSTDPQVFAVLSMAFVVVAMVAALVPARRAALVDPVVALRPE
jgi:putative ABC transport system permease protein